MKHLLSTLLINFCFIFSLTAGDFQPELPAIDPNDQIIRHKVEIRIESAKQTELWKW